jgi:spermidine/putrescine ABC transporter ATP-binding subunit
LARVEVEGLEARYGQAIALHDLSLTVASGEMFALLGASGSGKSTLLRALAGFIAPARGRILLDGRDVTREPPHRRPVNTVFQSYALFPHLTVAANVAFGLRRQGVPRREAAARVRDLLALVRLEGFEDRRPDALSGGQRQRVALARALAPRPGLLLLDEPLSALDRALREQTREELLRVQRETGTTFILVTHDQDEALSIAGRIGLLRDGRLAQVGTPADLYEHPASRYVAAFMGAENILPARVRDPGPPALLDIAGVGPARAVTAAPPGAAHVALRPERLRLAAPGGEPGENEAQGAIAASTYRGGTADYRVRLAAGGELLVSVPLTEGAVTGLMPPGSLIAVQWAPEACVLLPG